METSQVAPCHPGEHLHAPLSPRPQIPWPEHVAEAPHSDFEQNLPIHERWQSQPWVEQWPWPLQSFRAEINAPPPQSETLHMWPL